MTFHWKSLLLKPEYLSYFATNNMLTLDTLKTNQSVTIKALTQNGLTSKLMDMGMYPGKSVQIVLGLLLEAPSPWIWMATRSL